MNTKKKIVLIKCIVIFGITMPVAWGILYPIVLPLQPVWRDTVKYLLTAILTILFMILLWRKSLFSLNCPKFVHSLFTFGLLGLIGAAGAFVFSYEPFNDTLTIDVILGCILMNLAIAVSEEFLFRGVILNALLSVFDQEGRKSNPWKAVILANVIFGFRHLLNLIQMPETRVATFAQVIFTCMAGIYLCAVYLRSNNLWICIVIHFLEDFASSFWSISHWNSAGSSDTTVAAAIGMIALQIPYVVFACFMLNDKRWDTKESDAGRKPKIGWG